MQDAAVDACSLINVIAAAPSLLPLPTSTRRVSAKAKTGVHHLGITLHVPTKVADEESLYVLQPDKDDSTKLFKAKIDLDPFLKSGLLQRCDLDGEGEPELFVQFATRLDDGEAACLAIAKSRGWILATDDRKARTIANAEAVAVMTTPELLKQWASISGACDKEVSEVLQTIQRFARFVPNPTSPEYQWWVDHLTT
jgi:hypothetical protein